MAHEDHAEGFLPGERLIEVEELPSGLQVGGYIVDRLLARGGGGAVYVVRHARTLRRFALKVLHASLVGLPRMVERFVREVEVVNLLRHPNIVEIHRIDALPDGRPYCVMEYLDGFTLDEIVRQQGRLDPDDALELLDPVCAALGAAHAAGIVHRDVKGSNVSVSLAGGHRVVKLLDFGIAKLLHDDAQRGALTSAGRQIGTPSVMAPEQILGEPVDGRTDIYALGVLLHRLLTGSPPFRGQGPSEIARQHLEEPPPRPSVRAPVPFALDAVVLRCMEKQPARRYQSVTALRAALREATGRATRTAIVSAPESRSEAVAIHVEVRVDPADEFDDALVEDLGRALDLAEERLRAGGFTVILTTGNAVLAARPLPAADGADGRRASLSAARALHEALRGRPHQDPRVSLAITAHLDDAVIRGAPSPEFVGGPILDTSAWVAPPEVTGLCATPSILADLASVHDTGELQGFIALEGASRSP